jgi:peptidoglycan/xylan/chitin deacetylase (PgdA/CDA1 family)
MDWSTLGRLTGEGFSIGAHSRTHQALTALSTTELADEIGGSAERIHRELGVRPTAFAYPYGIVDPAAVDQAREFHWAVTTELRVFGPAEQALMLPRLDMYYFRAGSWIEAFGSARFRQYLWVRSRARRVRAALATAAE